MKAFKHKALITVFRILPAVIFIPALLLGIFFEYIRYGNSFDPQSVIFRIDYITDKKVREECKRLKKYL
jgi:hypothetical protein